MTGFTLVTCPGWLAAAGAAALVRVCPVAAEAPGAVTPTPVSASTTATNAVSVLRTNADRVPQPDIDLSLNRRCSVAGSRILEALLRVQGDFPPCRTPSRK